MIEKVKELLGSPDEELVKQGIELILNLGMEEALYLEFKDLLDDSDLTHLQMGPQFKKLCPHNGSLARLAFLSLISSGRKRRLSPPPPSSKISSLVITFQPSK